MSTPDSEQLFRGGGERLEVRRAVEDEPGAVRDSEPGGRDGADHRAGGERERRGVRGGVVDGDAVADRRERRAAAMRMCRRRRYFGLAPGRRGGTVELSGVSFTDLTNTHTISSATLTLYYWDELADAAGTLAVGGVGERHGGRR